MKSAAVSNTKKPTITAAFVLMAALSGCASTSTMGTSKVAPLTDTMRTAHKGDFQGLYEAWIQPQEVRAPGSGDKWGRIDIPGIGDQIASEKTITEGFANFCSDMGGKSEVQPLKYGHKDVCTGTAGEYLGEFKSERFNSGLAVRFDSREYRAQKEAMRQAAREAQSKQDYQSLKSPNLTIEQLRRLIYQFQGNDPEHLVPRAKERLANMVAQREKAAEQVRAEKLRRLENKHVGDQICHFDTEATVNVETNIRVFGVPQYRTLNGITKIVGFVEGINGMKIKIRISGITFRPYGGREKPVNSFTNYQGGSNLEVNSIIWDDTHFWEEC